MPLSTEDGCKIYSVKTTKFTAILKSVKFRMVK